VRLPSLSAPSAAPRSSATGGITKAVPSSGISAQLSAYLAELRSTPSAASAFRCPSVYWHGPDDRKPVISTNGRNLLTLPEVLSRKQIFRLGSKRQNVPDTDL